MLSHSKTRDRRRLPDGAPGRSTDGRAPGRRVRADGDSGLDLVRKTIRAFRLARGLGAGGVAITLLFGALWSGTAVATSYDLSDQWRWHRFTTADGLPSNRISDISEARDGTAWVSTSSGLAWYDGYRWHAMGPGEGLPRKPASHLTAVGPTGMLAVLDGKLYRGDRHDFHQVPIPDDDPQFCVRKAVPSPDGGLVVLVRYRQTGRRALLKLVGEKAAGFRGPPGSASSDIYNVWAPGLTTLWIHTLEGLYRWEANSWHLHLRVENRPRGVSHLRVSDGTGWAWIDLPLTGRGLWRWVTGEPAGLALATPRARIDALDVTQEDVLIVAQDSGTTLVQQDGTWSEVAPPPQVFGIRSLRFRANGDLWAGTDHGLFLYHAASRLWDHWRDPASTSNNRVNEIVQGHDGSVWIASDAGVERRLPDGQVERSALINGRNVGDSTGLAQDLDGNIWLTSGSTYQGAFRFDGLEWSYFGPEQGLPGYRHKVRTDRRGRAWFLGLDADPRRRVKEGTGAAVYEDGRFTHWTTAEGLIHNRVYAFAEGLEGELWFGTFQGLSRWEAGQWTHWTTADGLKEARIWALAVDERNTLWFADRFNGLGMIAGDALRYLTVEDGLLSDEVQDVRSDPRGGIWVSCRGGVARFKGDRWYPFPATGGIGHPSLWPVLPTDDRVFIGTLGAGTVVLNRPTLERTTLQISLTEPVVYDRSATFRWHVAARDALINGEDIETRYRFENGEWSEWGLGRLATGTARPGAHTFTVQARSRLADSPTAEDHVSFAVPFPVYRHPMAVLLALAAFLILVSLTSLVIVRRRRYNAALREREQDLRALFDTFDDFLFILDLDGRIVDTNLTAQRHLGYSAEQLWGRPLVGIYPADRREEAKAVLADKSAGRTLVSCVPLVASDGASTPVETRITHGKWKGRDVLFGVSRDISARQEAEEELRKAHEKLEARVEARTAELSRANRKLQAEIRERQRAEEALRESEERFDWAVRGSSDGFWDWPDTRRDSEWWSARFYELLGYENGELEANGRVFRELLHPDDRERTTDAKEAHLREHIPYDVEYRLKTKSGQYRWFRARAQALWDDHGAPMRMAGSVQDITERQQAEEALRRSEEHYRTLLASIPVGVFRSTPEGKLVSVNPALVRMLGCESEEELRGMPAASFYAVPECRGELLRRLRTEGLVKDFEIQIRRKDGSTLWVSANVDAGLDDQGKLAHFVGTAENITERKQAAEALKESRERLRLLFDLSHDAVLVTDDAGRFLRVNQAACGMLGYTESRLLQMGVDDLLTPQNCPSARVLFDAFLAKGKARGDFVFLRSDGTRRVAEYGASSIGTNLHMTVLRDVTERKRAEEALRESEGRYRSLFEDSPISLWEEDFYDVKRHLDRLRARGVKDFRAYFEDQPEAVADCARMIKVVEVNRATLELCEAGSKDELRAGLDRIFDKESHEVLREELVAIAEGETLFESEATIHTVTGGTKWIALRWSVAPGYAGTLSKVLVSLIDITERKRIEELVLHQQNELAHVSRLSTMGEMVSGIAHELNQPLAAVTNYAKGCMRMLRSGTNDSRMLLEGMGRVAAQAQRAGEIIRHLRTLMSRGEPKRVNTSVTRLIREVLHFVEPDARQQGTAVRLELTDGLKPVVVDSIQIQQVILNLTRNAFEAMGGVENGVRAVTIKTAPGEGDAVEVSIHDTGPGLSADVADRIFDPFFTTKPQGMGMGLSISRTIIDAHGGRLWATSNSVGGATFRFTLPTTDGADRHG